MKYLIVARWKEDTSWLQRVNVAEWNVEIEQKGTPELPNVGREPDTFLWVMSNIAAFDGEDDDVYAFVQGWPFDHSPHLLENLEKETTGFRWLSEHRHVSDGNGAPAHGGLPVKEKYEEWLGRPFPGSVEFYAGGQFVLTSKEIKKYDREFYQKLRAEMAVGQNPWVMERLWFEFFRLK